MAHHGTRTPFVSAFVAALACALVALAPAAQAAGSDRYAVGDSVMLGAKSQMLKRGVGRVDALQSRQAYSGPATLRKAGARLPENVIIHLGTNGTFPLDVCRKMVKTAGPGRRVFFVTIHVPRSWKASNNKVIRACDAAFAPDRVHVVDWDYAASAHPSWLYRDRTHLTPTGAQGYARLIDRAVDEVVGQAAS